MIDKLPKYCQYVNMIISDTSRHNDILEAAFTQFIQYGFQKTTMADIANASSISRPSIYTYFDNKEEIFKATCIKINKLSHQKVVQFLEGNHQNWTVRMKIEAALSEHYFRFLEISKSPHGSELYHEHNRLCGEIAQKSVKQLRNLLTEALKRADLNGEIDLKNINTSAAMAAEILQMSTAGLKAELPPVKTFKKRLKQFVIIFFTGLEPTTSGKQDLAKAM
jgi:AcrR family transcriptional regulator